MSSVQKVFIKIESSSEQEEKIKNIRKKLKPLQTIAKAGDKENLTGRTPIKDLRAKSKSFTDSEYAEIIRRKNYETKSTQTDATANNELLAKEDKSISSNTKQITENDLMTDTVGEHYWEILAEKRRIALEQTLEENKNLYERINSLEEELEISKKMIEEGRALSEVLVEMLNSQEDSANSDVTAELLDNNEASTSGLQKQLQQEDSIDSIDSE